MVGSIVAGSPQPTPPSRSFEAGQAPNDPLKTQKINQGPEPVQTQNTSVSPGIEEEINDALVLSRDVSRPNPSQISSNTATRGSVLDITI